MSSEPNPETAIETETSTIISRRQAVRGGATAAAVVTIGGVGLWYGAQPTLAASVSAWSSDQDEVSIETNDGSIDEVNIDPVAEVSWSGFAADEHDISLSIDVSLPDDEESADSVLTETLESVDTTGEETELFTDEGGVVNILGEGTISAETFGEDESGATNSTDVEVSLVVDSTNPDIEAATAADTVTISVTNVVGETESSGSFDTEVESEEEIAEEETD